MKIPKGDCPNSCPKSRRPFHANELWNEADALTITHTTVRVGNWPADCETLKVGVLADTHCCDQNALERAERAAHMLMAQTPDVVLLAGDLITKSADIWAPRLADALAPLASAPDGVFFVLGNHDCTGGGEEVVPAEMNRVGFTFLRNQSAPLQTRPDIWVVGLDDLYHHRQDVGQAMKGIPTGAGKLLLVHEPDYADKAPPGFALQVSGHSHGGQIRLPGIPPLHLPKYCRRYPEGLRQSPHHPVYTTRGVGTTGVSFRLFCPPEVSMLYVKVAPN